MSTQKIPVTILTGFLGAGKTTLLNYILKEQTEAKYAIIENEFGAVGVDEAIVTAQRSYQSTEEVVELNNGCVCCTVRGDLVKVVQRIIDEKADVIDGIIIETTGLADPGPVAQTFYVEPALQERCELDGIITVVDAKHVLLHLHEKRGEGVSNESVEQVAFADRILLNKVDLVTRDEIDDIKLSLRAINKSADIIECEHSVVDPKKLIGLQAFNLDRVLDDLDPSFLSADDGGNDDARTDPKHAHGHGHAAASASTATKEEAKGEHAHGHGHGHAAASAAKQGHGHDHTGEDCTHASHAKEQSTKRIPLKRRKQLHDMEVTSIGFTVDEPLNLGHLRQWITYMMQTEGQNLFRYKGVIDVMGHEERFVFQGVHMMFDGSFQKKWVEGEKRMSKFIFIGRKLDKEKLRKGFMDCIAKPLRFKVGDRVGAKVSVDGYSPGTVIKLWDDGNPYRIKLDTGVEVYGPVDNDMLVRKLEE